MTWNYWRIVNNELKRMWGKTVFVAWLSCYPNIFQEELRKTISQDICSAISSTKIQNRHLFNIVSSISTWIILRGEILSQGYRCLAILCEQKGTNTAKSCSSLQHKYGGIKKGKDAMIEINMLWTNTCIEICGQREGVKVTTINVDISRQWLWWVPKDKINNSII